MDYLLIEGGRELSGEIKISGSKNASLPLIASTILAKNRVNISNVPNVADIKTLLQLIENIGGEYSFANGVINISTQNIEKTTALYDIVRTMRASILTLGPLLARFGHCEVSLPGGCAIGERPVDLHLKALAKMGANIEIKNGYILANCEGSLNGAEIVFDKITVTGTENIIMAAALANGESRIINSAKEPEVVQLCELLRDAGVSISGIGSSELTIKGTNRELLNFPDIRVIPDRIEAGTYLCAGAITNSNIVVRDVIPAHIQSITSKLIEMGVPLNIGEDFIEMKKYDKLHPTNIITKEYPAFPTDMQAQFMALATQAEGTTIIEETLFENRFMHVSELRRVGAKIHLKGTVATIEGKTELFGADLMATDLRASSALILAGLVAKGFSKVHRIYHLDRGYEKLEEKLNSLGANIKRLIEPK